ncbi:MAG: pyridoxal phosphate-dependent aminotransferase [Methanomassiliicoccales archaeon]|nr:MAG: pyridoxal phosphate-dependent aminotransferase [Methanomassiliicoccales archaeon]
MDEFEYAHKHWKDVVWMSQNTNTIPTDPAVIDAIISAAKERVYNLYPYRKGSFGLPEAILKDLGLHDLDIHITNGGIEALYILNRALLAEGDEVIATDPSFMPIHHQITLSKAKPVEIGIYGNPYKMTEEQVNEAVTDKTKMILLIDPLNPLGTDYRRNEVKAICEIARDNNLWVVDDITYRDFSEDHTLTTDFYPEKSLIAYSFSKNCGMAGLRIGALLAPPRVMKEVIKFDTNVLSVNVLAQRAALTALQTKENWLGDMLRICRNNQEKIESAVDKIEGAFLPVYPSFTNMFVIDVSELGIDPDKFEEKMLYDHGVFVRSGNYVSKRYGSKFVRVSFTVPEDQCDRFVEALGPTIESLS